MSRNQQVPVRLHLLSLFLPPTQIAKEESVAEKVDTMPLLVCA